MIPEELIEILINLGFDCKTNGYRVIINRLELPDCKKCYNYFDLIPSFKVNKVFVTFCTYDYRNEFKQQMKDFIIQEERNRKIKNILDAT